MRVGIYHPTRGDVTGGAEQVVVTMAEVLSEHHQVDLLHHGPRLTREHLARHCGAQLSGVELRYLPPETEEVSWARPWRRYLAERDRYAEVTRRYDLLVASGVDLPPFCHARRGALFVHFPYFDRNATWPYACDGNTPRQRLRQAYALWEWRKRFEGYQQVLVNSGFTERYTRKWWGLESQVVYAPAKVDFRRTAKRNQILSVGRFATTGNSKKQLELMRTFCGMAPGVLAGWQYLTVGGIGDVEEHRAYFERVREAAEPCGAVVRANVERRELDELYEQSRIFWHAAGFGERLESPGLMEHFGIATVEAMAAGCVPVVLARGGQTEIVEHGVSGFLWESLEELEHYTGLLLRDEALLARMSEAARRRAEFFSRDAFARRLLCALEPLLT